MKEAPNLAAAGARGPTRACIVLTVVIALLTTLAAGGGIFAEDLYRDNEFVKLAWRVNDRVTLYLGVPLLVGSFAATLRGSTTGRLLWLGMLWFLVYNYAFYLFGAAFNAHFLLYVALFCLPALALIGGLTGLDVAALRATGPRPLAARLVGTFMTLWGVMLGAIWTSQSVAYLRTGALPELLALAGSQVHLIAALDLSLVVPSFLLAGVWLWRGSPWGVVVGVLANVKGAVYCVVLGWGAKAGAEAGFPGGELFPLWLSAGVLCAGSAVALLPRGVRAPPRTGAPLP